MKALLATNEEFVISSAFMQADNQLGISFNGVIGGYDAFRSKLTVTSTKVIKVYETEETFTPYENFTKVIPKTVTELEDGTLEIFIVFEREDALSQRVRSNEENIISLFDAVDFLLLGNN